jgi:hypothetical protein
MSAGGGDFECAFDGFLAFDLGEIEIVVGELGEELMDVDARRMDLDVPFEEGDGFTQVADGDDLAACARCGPGRRRCSPQAATPATSGSRAPPAANW